MLARNKRSIFLCLTIAFVMVFVLPKTGFCQDSTPWPLKAKEVESLMDIMRKDPLIEANREWFFNALTNDYIARDVGAVVLVRQAILSNQLNYWFDKLPKEISKKLLRVLLKAGQVLINQDPSAILSTIESLSVQAATEYGTQWLMQNEIKAASGELTYTFTSYKNNTQTFKITYIILLKPTGQTSDGYLKSDLIAEFYSNNPIEPPIGRGSYGGPEASTDWLTKTVWPWDRWLDAEQNGDNDGKIEPFILRVKGSVIKKEWSQYIWDQDRSSPVVEVDFNNPVPQIEQADLIFGKTEKEMQGNFVMDEIVKPLLSQVWETIKQQSSQVKDKTQQAAQAAQEIIQQLSAYLKNLPLGGQISQPNLRFDTQNPLPQNLQSILADLQTLNPNSLPTDKNEAQNSATTNILPKGSVDPEDLMGQPDLTDQLDTIAENIELISLQLQQIQTQSQHLLSSSIKPQNSTSSLSAEPIEETATTSDEEDEEMEIPQTTPSPVPLCSLAGFRQSGEKTVILNEIAWMGTATSSNDEWMELKNIAEYPVNIKGWQLLSQSQQIKIILPDLTVTPGGFSLLERTDDNSVPNIKADFIYTGALSNSNETLYLFDKNCILQEKLVANPWQFGNNTTKQTMERASGLNWQTSKNPLGTPKAENSTGEVYFASHVFNASQQNAASTPTPKILITEIQTESASSTAYDFIELYNPNNETADISKFQLKKRSSTGTEYSIKVLPENSKITANNYFLWVNSNYAASTTNPSINSGQVPSLNSWQVTTSTQTIASNNSIALIGPNDQIIDQVAWGSSTAPFVETNPFPQNPKANQNLARKQASTTQQYQDTNDNSQDFELQSPTPGANNIATLQTTTTPPSTTTAPATTTLDQITTNVVISEIQLQDNEFIELYNPTLLPIDMSNWYFAYFSSSRDWNKPQRLQKFPTTIASSTIPTNGYYLIGLHGFPTINGDPNSDWQPYDSKQLNDNNGSVGIFNCDPSIASTTEQAKSCAIDSLGWGQTIVKEATSALPAPQNQSLTRKQNQSYKYIDNNINGTDFVIASSTPFNSQGQTLVPPAPLLAITDLQAGPSAIRNAIDLYWTANNASQYQIKFAEKEITEQATDTEKISWQDATNLNFPNAPQPSDEIELLTIPDLDPSKTYYFALKTITDKGAVSLISNTTKAKPIAGFQDNNDGTITDLFTGLMWPNPSAGSGQDPSAGASSEPQPNSSGQAVLFTTTTTQFNAPLLISQMNATGGFAGYADWRMPTLSELADLIHYEKSSPMIDNVFTNIQAKEYWTLKNEFHPSGFPGVPSDYKGWYVDFSTGQINTTWYTYDNAPSYYFLPVRNTNSTCTLGWQDNGDTVTDLCSKLIWPKVDLSGIGFQGVFSECGVPWKKAIQEAGKTNISGFADWRLPNARELVNFADQQAGNNVINWTFTPNFSSPSQKWFVEMRLSPGVSNTADQSQEYYVRVVRNTQ